MSNIVPFKESSLPAHIKARMSQVDNSALGTVASGFPVISLKGKRFALVRSGAREIINDPRTDEPANHITVAILRVNPGMSKAYYAEGYQEGADAKPDCFSNDGLRPDAAARDPQAKSCASCPFNAFGSSNTGRGKACPDTKRLAVAQVDKLEEPILLRVPPTSLKNLANFGGKFTSKGIDIRYIATKIGFDPQATHQLLTFDGVGYLDDAAIEQVMAMQDDDAVLQITGEKAPAREAAPVPAAKPKARLTVVEDAEEEEEAPAPAPKAKVKPAPVVEEDEEEDDAPITMSAREFTKPRVKVRADVDEAPAPKPRAKVKTDIEPELESDIGDFLDAAFDDD